MIARTASGAGGGLHNHVRMIQFSIAQQKTGFKNDATHSSSRSSKIHLFLRKQKKVEEQQEPIFSKTHQPQAQR
jgi:hypothetical protein